MIINGAAKEIGRAAVVAVTRARGMEVAGAVDSYCVGEDIGKAVFSTTITAFAFLYMLIYGQKDDSPL